MSLLVEAFENLPQRGPGDDPDLFRAGAEAAVAEFRQLVRERYTEGTLGRILASHLDPRHRRAAVTALGLVGTMASNAVVANALRDDDERVRAAAVDAVWEVWFRGDDGGQGMELRQAIGLPDTDQRMAACDDLIREYPDFAEAYNQRAIQHFNRGSYSLAVSDCEAVLRLNPYHFGAAAGLGQCYLRMNKPRAAVRSFAHALDLNPHLSNLKDVLTALRDSLGDDKASALPRVPRQREPYTRIRHFATNPLIVFLTHAGMANLNTSPFSSPSSASAARPVHDCTSTPITDTDTAHVVIAASCFWANSTACTAPAVSSNSNVACPISRAPANDVASIVHSRYSTTPTSPPHRNAAHSSWASGITACAASHAAVPPERNATILAISSASIPAARATSTLTTSTCVPADRPALMPSRPAVRVMANTSQNLCHRQPNPHSIRPTNRKKAVAPMDNPFASASTSGEIGCMSRSCRN